MLSKIKSIKPNEVLRDDQIKGLHARCFGNGTVTFYIYYRTKSGKERRPSIGRYPEISIQEARRRATVIKAKVSLGEDPKGIWDAKKQEATLSELFSTLLKKKWDKPRFHKSGYFNQVQNLWSRHFYQFRNEKISGVSIQELNEWADTEIQERPISYNRSRSLLSEIYRYAIDQGYTKDNLASRLPKALERKRSRYATEEELRLIFNRLHELKDSDPENVKYVLTLLYTGARPETMKNIKHKDIKVLSNGFGEVEIKGKKFNKTGESDIYYLPKQIMDLIDYMPGSEVPVFRKGYPKYFWSKLTQELGIEGLWLRDLRRTFGSIGLNSGLSIDVVAELLNHESVQTTKRYAKLFSGKRLEASEAMAENIERLVSYGI